MTSIKKKLSNALDISNIIEKEQRSEQSFKAHGGIGIESVKEVNVGDENGVYSIACSNDASKVAIGTGTGSLQIFNSVSWERIRKIRAGILTNLPLLAVKFYPCLSRNVVFTAGSDGMIKVWNMDTYTKGQTTDEEGNEIMCLDFSPNGTYFATGGKMWICLRISEHYYRVMEEPLDSWKGNKVFDDCSVRLYNSDNLSLFREYPKSSMDQENQANGSVLPGHNQKVMCVKFQRDDANVFLTAAWDHTVKVWDCRTSSAVRTIHGPFVCGDGLDILHDRILTASWISHNALQVWDLGSGQLIETLDVPTEDRNGEYLYCARFLNQQNIIAGGSGTNDLKIIDTQKHVVTDTVSGNGSPVQCIEVCEKDNQLMCGTSKNILKIATLFS